MTAPPARTVALVGDSGSADARAVAETLASQAERAGWTPAEPGAARLVVNLTDADAPVAHWRRTGLHQLAVSVARVPHAPDGPPGRDVVGRAYPVLLRTLSNAVLAVDGEDVVLVTPELGRRALAASSVAEAILPLALARFAIANRVLEDLSAAETTAPEVEDLRAAGRRLAALGLLPAPVQLAAMLGAEDRALLRAVFGLQQLSYGNASVRAAAPGHGFWMTGRGVDKSRLEVVGRDVVLVAGADLATGEVTVRVPRGHPDARASVDAIEHALIYEAFPSVGAVVHVHAWIDGVDATSQSWPCGTVELAREVLALVRRQPDPARAEVGLRNHGLTLTGPSPAAILDRVAGRLVRDVPTT